jgi:hypothetical protein
MVDPSNSSLVEEDLDQQKLIRDYVDAPDFIERHWLEKRVLELLDDPTCQFLLLTAVPGAGKTALLAWLAQRHPDWLRYFLRWNSKAPLRDGSARSFLVTIGFQLLARRASLFRQDSLELAIKVEAEKVGHGGKLVGLRTKLLQASPFRRIAADIVLSAGTLDGEAVAVEAERITEVPDLGALQLLALFGPARVLQQLDPAARIVILVDALDEAGAIPRGERLLDWLTACPSDLPANVRFVLASRPDEPALPLLREKQAGRLRDETIDLSSRQVRSDLESYAAQHAEQPPLRNVLRSRTDGGTFPARAVDKAEGNFQYLAALFSSIQDALLRAEGPFTDGPPQTIAASASQDKERQEARDQVARFLQLDEVPTGLQELYAFFLNCLQDSVKEQGVPVDGYTVSAWPTLYAPFLAVLAVAREPLAGAQLARLAGIRADEAWTWEVLRRSRQFLQESQGRYRLYHATFADFLTAPMTRASHPALFVDKIAWHRRIVKHYRGEAPDWEAVDWERTDNYGLDHLAEHLHALRAAPADRQQLFRLPCLSLLREKYARKGSHHAFLTDVGLAIAAAEEVGKAGLPDLIGLSLLSGSLASLESAVPLPALRALVLLGDTERALRLLLLMTDPEKQARAYWELAFLLWQRDQHDLARTSLERSLPAVARIRRLFAQRDAVGNTALLAGVFGMRNVLPPLLDLAVRLVADSPYLGASALGDVASYFAVWGEEQRAREAARSAADAANGILDAAETDLRQLAGHLVPETYADVARGLLAVGEREEARLLLRRALDVLDRYARFKGHLEKLDPLLEALAEAADHEGLHEALRVASRFPSDKADALLPLARAMARVGSYADVRAVVDHLAASPAERVEALGEAATVLAERSEEEQAADSDRLFADAIAEAAIHSAAVYGSPEEDADPAVDQAATWNALAAAHLAAGDNVAGLKSAGQALEIARRIRDPNLSIYHTMLAARRLAEAGETSAAVGALHGTLELVALVPEHLRDHVLGNLVDSMRFVGDRDGLRNVQARVDEWLKDQYQDKTRRDVALALLLLGETEAAVSGANSLRPVNRRFVLAELAELLAGTGQQQCARDLVTRALLSGEPPVLGEADFRARLALARGLAEAGAPEEAGTALAPVLAKAARAGMEVYREEVLDVLAQIRSREGLSLAQTSAGGIEDPHRRSLALAAVAVALNQAGAEDEARALAQQLFAAPHVLYIEAVALLALLDREQARAWFLEALKTRDEGERPRARVATRIALAKALVQAGLRDLLRGPCLAAMDLLEQYAEFDTYVVCYSQLASSLAALGEAGVLRRALAALERVEPKFLPWRPATVLAEALADAGEPKDAGQALLRLRAVIDGFGRGGRLDEYLSVGRALVAVGEMEAGRSVLHEVVRDLPTARWDECAAARILARVAEALPPADRLSARALLERSLQMIGRLESDLDHEPALPDAGRAILALGLEEDNWAARVLAVGFEDARGRGRHDVLWYLAAFSPVLTRLGVIKQVWDRVQAAERHMAELLALQ